ncbi:MAG: hypothetical protein NDJ89_16540 [Oligoflexia bacterium]|nr:hypothetical protein [Oligoflexia bacterium]
MKRHRAPLLRPLTLALLLAGLGARVETASAAPPEAFEVKSGRGFVARANTLFGETTRPILNTHWVSLKLHPFRDGFRPRPFGLQAGLQQSEDATRAAACRLAPSIAGKSYCGTEGAAYFTALYGGMQAELVELAAADPRPLRITVGAGASAIRAAPFEGTALQPYSSLELGYQLREKLQARAAAFVSYIGPEEGLGISAPTLALEYRF